MCVDANQVLGTFIGLDSKLLLRHQKTGKRILIVPDGPVQCTPMEYKSSIDESSVRHVRVQIDIESSTRAHTYDLDSQLGRLIDNGSLQSKLFMCYLHSVTSSCLIDPLTCRTGTEQALSILQSAAVKSFLRLSSELLDILRQLGQLVPIRSYYPAHERVMQSVQWSKSLGFMAQHNGFLGLVQSIVNQSNAYIMFQPESDTDDLALSKNATFLLERDSIRLSTFRVSGFGAEDFSTKFDETYKSRDEQPSVSERNAFAISTIIHNRRCVLYKKVQSNLGQYLWDSFSAIADIYGPNHDPPLEEINYDARLLLSSHSLSFIARNWSSLHCMLRGKSLPHPVNKYRLMVWFSTLAFAENVNSTILQTLAAFFTNPDMEMISAPPLAFFQLKFGYNVKTSALENVCSAARLMLQRCPEGTWKPNPLERHKTFHKRRKKSFNSNQNQAFRTLLLALAAQWPCEVPLVPPDEHCTRIRTYVDVPLAIKLAKSTFKSWFDNLQYFKYLQELAKVLYKQHISPVGRPVICPIQPRISQASAGHIEVFVSIDKIFQAPAPSLAKLDKSTVTGLIYVSETPSVDVSSPRLTSLIERLQQHASSNYEIEYVKNLRSSLDSYQKSGRQNKLHLIADVPEEIFPKYLHRCRVYVRDIEGLLLSALGCRNRHGPQERWPRVSPIFLLQQLARKRWTKILPDWQRCIVEYGIALTELHRAERLLGLAKSPIDLIKELQNPGHSNWSPLEHPESLLLEIESGIMIREVQERIAGQMREPQSNTNAVMQLNMGEGKSSVIVPIVAAHLADGTRLVRVIVAKPQSKQMLEMLVSKLGGLLDRQIYHLPFSRALKLGRADGHGNALAINKMYRECMINGGILLVQPEHILSFKLMVLECYHSGKELIGKSLLSTKQFLDKVCRDIVDESDENFSVKFELVYTMGTQEPIDFSPDRWLCIQNVLGLVGRFAPDMKKKLPQSLEVDERRRGGFPRTRFLRPDAEKQILGQIAHYICETGTTGFPLARYSESVRQAVFKYLTEPNLSAENIGQVEDESSGEFWTPSARNTLLLLRGLIAGGVLSFAFSQKRWRVNYGLDIIRQPSTKLAVPYRAKDNPTARSEFSHPDVVIILTYLTHYYGGLSDEDLTCAFEHLLRSNQAVIEYHAWVTDAPDLGLAFHTLEGVNLKDQIQCLEQIYPKLRFSKGAIDYFLAHIVFPREMKQFSHKLSASGWDIAQTKKHPTTGFSGTNDSRKLLPLSMKHLDLPEQEHTNALVLKYLLRDENTVALTQPHPGITDAGTLLATVTQMSLAVQVILDVGAQIIELSNSEVAKEWLKLMSHDKQVQAAVFFNDNDELYVLDRKDNVEPLQTSSFATQLDRCLVYMDESHTRGTDLKLPNDYRAAVTLGPNLTKDRLVQGKSAQLILQAKANTCTACMRMRKLGQGQSVVFYISEEIETKIITRLAMPKGASVDVSDVINWTICETFDDIRKSIPHWKVQGERFEQQTSIWNKYQTKTDILMSKARADEFLEDEMQSLEYRYRPVPVTESQLTEELSQNHNLNQIAERCKDIHDVNFVSATLQEEQERELAPEIEQERQIQMAAPAQPATHQLSPDVIKFVSEGTLVRGSKAFMPAFKALQSTTAAKYLDVDQFPKQLLVTTDFATTIQLTNTKYNSDIFQRPVQWVLTSTGNPCSSVVQHVMIISPFEAQELLPSVASSKTTSLHMYAPRPNLSYRALDNLDLFTVPNRKLSIPRQYIVLLNLFAGQLYLNSFNEYTEVCELLGLSWEKSDNETTVAADGFILKKNGRLGQSTFTKSPVNFVKELMTKVRRNCESIEKTHMGKILNGTLLTREDFEEDGTDKA
jgi:hypothetical protein